MRIDAKDPTGKKKFTGEADGLTKEGINKLNDLRIPALGGTERDVDRFIDNLDIPGDVPVEKWAEARLELKEMSKVIIEVIIDGVKTFIRVGRKILDCILYVSKEYPNATIGLIFGALIGTLVAMIPVIGFLIGGLVQIIAPLIGAVIGLREDIEDRDLRRTIQRETRRFKDLDTD